MADINGVSNGGGGTPRTSYPSSLSANPTIKLDTISPRYPKTTSLHSPAGNHPLISPRVPLSPSTGRVPNLGDISSIPTTETPGRHMSDWAANGTSSSPLSPDPRPSGFFSSISPRRPQHIETRTGFSYETQAQYNNEYDRTFATTPLHKSSVSHTPYPPPQHYQTPVAPPPTPLHPHIHSHIQNHNNNAINHPTPNHSQSHIHSLPHTSTNTPTGSQPGALKSNLTQLIAERERELESINEWRRREVVDVSKEKEGVQYKQLLEDFEFNKRVIQERDAELETLYTEKTEWENKLTQKDTTISDYKDQQARLDVQLKEKDAKIAELEALVKKAHTDHAKQIEEMEWRHKDTLEQSKREYDSIYTHFQQDFSELDEKYQSVQKEYTMACQEYENALKERKQYADEQDVKYKQQINEANNKIVLLEKDLGSLQSYKTETKDKIPMLTNAKNELEKKIKVLSYKQEEDAREYERVIMVYKQEVNSLNNIKEQMLSEYESKIQGVLHTLHSAEEECTNLRQQHASQVQTIQKEREEAVQELYSKMESLKDEYNKQLEAAQHEMEERENRIKQLEIALEESESNKKSSIKQLESLHARVIQEKDNEIKEQKHEIAQQDKDIQAQQEKYESLERTLQEKQSDITQDKIEIGRLKDKINELNRKITEQRIAYKKELDDKCNTLQNRYEEKIRRLEKDVEEKNRSLHTEQSRTMDLTRTVEQLRSAQMNAKNQTQIITELSSQLTAAKSELNTARKDGKVISPTPTPGGHVSGANSPNMVAPTLVRVHPQPAGAPGSMVAVAPNGQPLMSPRVITPASVSATPRPMVQMSGPSTTRLLPGIQPVQAYTPAPGVVSSHIQGAKSPTQQ